MPKPPTFCATAATLAACLPFFAFDTSAAPTANPEAYEFPEDTLLESDAADGVLAHDVPDGGVLSAVLDSDASNGTLSLNSDGSFTYQPNPEYNSGDSFTFKAQSLPDTLTFTIDQ